MFDVIELEQNKLNDSNCSYYVAEMPLMGSLGAPSLDHSYCVMVSVYYTYSFVTMTESLEMMIIFRWCGFL